MLRAIGLFNRDVRELLATYYQFDAPFIVDHTVFTTTFGGAITGWDDVVDRTLASYRNKGDEHLRHAPDDVST